MVLALTVVLAQLAGANPGLGALPAGCTLKQMQDFEMIDCPGAIGYAHAGRKDVFTREGMETSVLAGLKPRVGEASGRMVDELGTGPNAIKADRFELKKAGATKTTNIWFVTRESGNTMRLLVCLGKPGAADARANCGALFPLLEKTAASELGTPANATNTAPVLFGKALQVPAGCEARGGTTIRCGTSALTVQQREGDQVSVSDYARGIATNLRGQGADVTERSRACILDGEKSDCVVLGLKADATVRIIVMGIRSYGEKKSAFLTCTAPEISTTIPSPCDQVMAFPKSP